MHRQLNLGFRATLTKSEKLLRILADGKPHSTKELSRRVSHAFAGSIFKLRRAGYLIEKQHHPTRDYQWEYRLVGTPPNNDRPHRSPSSLY